MSDARVRVEIGGNGAESRVYVNGVDITRLCSGVSVSVEQVHPSTVTVQFVPGVTEVVADMPVAQMTASGGASEYVASLLETYRAQHVDGCMDQPCSCGLDALKGSRQR